MVKLKLPKREEYIASNPLKRIGAFLIDMLILQFIVVSVFSSNFENFFQKNSDSFMSTYLLFSTNPALIKSAFYAIISIGVLMMIYFVYLEYKYSQSIGMMFFSLHAKSIENGRISLWQSVLRNLYLLPIFPVVLLWVIDPIYFLFKGERLSEKLSKTKTVEVANYGY